MLAESSAEQSIRIAVLDQHCTNQRCTATHFTFGILNTDATTAHNLMVILPQLLVARIRVRVNQFKMLPSANTQAVAIDAFVDNVRTTN